MLLFEAHILWITFSQGEGEPPNANSCKVKIFPPFKPSTLEMWEEEGLFSSRQLSTHIV